MIYIINFHAHVRITNLFGPTLTVAAAISPETLGAAAHEQADTLVGENTLLHAEALLVIASHDLEDVALE